MISSVFVTIAAVSLFIWALAKQGNGGPLFENPQAVEGVDPLVGSKLGWMMMRLITSGIGGWSGGVSDLSIVYTKVDDPTICRFCTRAARKPQFTIQTTTNISSQTFLDTQ